MQRRKRTGYRGKAGVFKTGAGGYRSIDNRGRVANVELPLGVTEPTNTIRNPFRSGQWDWRRERLASGRPAAPRPTTPPPTPAPPVVPQQEYNPYIGPWIQGFDATGTGWAPMVGGGFMNTNTGQAWSGFGGAPTTQADSYEQSLVDMIKGMLEGL